IPGAVRTNLEVSSSIMCASSFGSEKRTDTSSQKQEDEFQPPEMDPSVYMDPEEIGERVLRGIKRNDLFIITHPEFREGFAVRCQALLRAVPNEPINE